MRNSGPRATILGALLICVSSIAIADSDRDAQKFINDYAGVYRILQYQVALAEWASNTHIVEGDTMNAFNTKQANEQFAAFTGSRENIERARELLTQRAQLNDLTVRQLEAILYAAANNPQTVPDLVRKRIAAETLQNEKLFGFDFMVDSNSVSTNEIDEALRTETDLARREVLWTASKEVGVGLKPGLVELQGLRNSTVQALGYDDYFQYQVSDYGMTSKDLVDLMDRFVRELRPLYRELHTYVRYMLAEKYGAAKVPDMIPAHWLPNRWGQDWLALVSVEGLDLDAILKEREPQWLVEQAERFYVSVGFDPLPESFYLLSDLYPLGDGAVYKKNNHASAWHMDLENDLRSLMSVIPNADWYETTHHELGHIYYYQSYSTPEVPLLLRKGANRAFHEGVGSLLGLAAMQKPFLEHIELLAQGQETDEIQVLLKEALNYVVFIPWSAGVMTQFEHELYANKLPAAQFNAKWWELKSRYQGIIAPGERGEEYCDAASKTHINNDAAQYYDYAMSYILLFQIHDHIATRILKQSPRATNYYGNLEVGSFLRKLLAPGATRDWRELMKETLGQDMSAEPMLRYFEPLMTWLQEQNKGRKHTLPKV